MTDTIRSFIAIELPGQVVETIRELQENLRKYRLKIRWVRPENIHLTLKFLGNISEKDVEPITEVLKTMADTMAPLHLMGKGLGTFPGISRPRVVWVGVSGDTGPLEEFQLRVEEGLEQLGFPKERRPFRVHLTIGRVKEKLDKRILLQAIEQLGNFQSDPFTAESIALFRSDLRQGGAVYTKLAEVPFCNVLPHRKGAKDAKEDLKKN